MNDTVDAESQEVTVVNDLGLHARSAAQIVNAVRSARSRVWICKDDNCADAFDMLDLMSLQCPQGSCLTIRIEDSADEAVLKALVELVESGFGELTQDE